MIADLLAKFANRARPQLPAAHADGRVWHLTPAWLAEFGAAAPRPERWAADGSAAVVKANPARTVYRVELPGGTVFVKHCRVTGPRAWGREAIRPPKARMEFDNALALRRRGVPAVEPLAWGAPDSVWPGESFLVTRGLPAVPLVEYLERDFPALAPDARRAAAWKLSAALGVFFARLHDAGVAHPDPHPGNLLVEAPPGGGFRFALIDLHDVALGPPLPWAASRDNLALFNRWFRMRTTRPDRVRFWRAYRGARASLPPEAGGARAKELERETDASNLRLWAKRELRWLGTSRSIRRVRRGPVRGLAVRDLPTDYLAALLADPDAAFAGPGVQVLKHSKSSTVAVVTVPTPAGPARAVLKRVPPRSWVDPLKNLFRRSPALRSWVNGHTLRDRGVPTPRPLAVFHRYRAGFPVTGYVLTELVPDAVQFDAAVRTGGVSEASLRLARVLRQMHDRGVSHRDLKAANVLLAGGTDPVLIDLVGVSTGPPLPLGRRARELARLNASFLANPAVTPAARLRFLRAYLAAGVGSGVGWKTWWGLVSRATAAKVARNRRRGRVLG
jgi:tRNA A-37 threonylcarbamoyl transferase component Bud32